MLQKLTKEIAECYEHARKCSECAERAVDPRWLSMAHSYEFTERLSNFTV